MTDDDIAARGREFETTASPSSVARSMPTSLALAQAAFDWSLANPGPAGSRPFDGIEGAFYQDLGNPAAPGRRVRPGAAGHPDRRSRHKPVG